MVGHLVVRLGCSKLSATILPLANSLHTLKPTCLGLRRLCQTRASMSSNNTAPAPPDGHGDQVDITRESFAMMLPLIRAELAACDFFAFDCEMTGLFLDGQRDEAGEDIHDRYAKLSAAAQSYIVNQLGLATFKQTAPGVWQAATFNLYIFPGAPSARQRFTCDAGSLAFLAGHGFDFNRMVSHGVPFVDAASRDASMAALRAQAAAEGSGSAEQDVVLSRPSDAALVEDLLGQVAAWLADPAGPATLTLPPINSFHRLVMCQQLAKLQGFFLEKVDGASAEGGPAAAPAGSGSGPRLVLTRASPEAVAAHKAALLEAKLEAVAAAAGATAVFEAMRDCGKPGVCHNGMFDVAFCLAAFAQPVLPRSWPAYRQLAAAWLPSGLLDTKHLACLLDEATAQPNGRGSAGNGNQRNNAAAGGLFAGETSLGELYAALTTQRQAEPEPDLGQPADAGAQAGLDAAAATGAQRLLLGTGLALPAVSLAPGYRKYEGMQAGQAAHEAGYDAYMTGATFAALLPLLQAAQAKGLLAPPPTGEAVDADPLAPARHLMGRLNLVRSTLPYAALLPSAGPDPVPRRPAAYVVSGLQPGARASDVATAFDACQLQGVGPALRVTFMSSSSAVVETGRPAPAQTAAVPGDTEGGAPSVSAAASAAVMLDTTVNGMRIMSYGLYYSLKSEHMARIGADDVPEQPARKRPRLLFEPPPPGVPAGAEGAAAAGGGKALLAGRPGGPVAEQQEQGGVGGQGASPAAAAGGWRPCVIM